MTSLLIRDARVLTLSAGPRPRRGAHMNRLNVLERADVITVGHRIAAVGQSLSLPPQTRVLEAAGRILMPGFIDCHTHACWTGDRVAEWEQRLAGKSYLDILRSGGGIMATVHAVRNTEQEGLTLALLARLRPMLHAGTTTVEVKSGYGLTPRDELKMLRAIAAAEPDFDGSLVPTALVGHALDPEQPDQVKAVIGPLLNQVHDEFPNAAVDAYCEQGAWSVDDCVKLFARAASLGHPVRVHTDQFHALGMVQHALRLKARSLDHLEATGPDDLKAVAASDATAVLLPCSGFHLDARYADGRTLIDHGGAVAVATNYNPGSAPCPSLPMAIALAVRHCRLTPAEAITACTVNAAHVLGLSDRGAIAPGQRADLILLRHRNERELAYEFGADPVDAVIAGGSVVRGELAR